MITKAGKTHGSRTALSIRVEELFEPIALRGKKGDRFLLFLQAFSWESLSNARWFYGKKRKVGKGNLYLTETQLSRNEIRCAANIHNYMCHICAKGFLDLNFNQAVLDKIPNFHEIAPNFTYSQKFFIFFLKYNWNLTNFFHINFMAGTWEESIFFFIFGSCEPYRAIYPWS